MAEHAAADRLVEASTSSSPTGGTRSDGLSGSRDRFEALLEACGQLVEVRLQAEPRVRMLGVAGLDPDQRRGQKTLDLGHRAHEALRCAPPSASRIEDARASFRRSSSARSARSQAGQACSAHTTVALARLDDEQAVRGQRLPTLLR